LKVWSLDECKEKIEDNFSWEVGNGKEIRLWDDRWVDNTNIKDAFPKLFTICSTKDSSIWNAGETFIILCIGVTKFIVDLEDRMVKESVCMGTKLGTTVDANFGGTEGNDG